MKNLTFGKDNITKVIAETAKQEAPKTETIITSKEKTKEQLAEEKAIISMLERIEKDQKKVLCMAEEVYSKYASNPISSATDSMEAALRKIVTAIEDIKEFGR